MSTEYFIQILHNIHSSQQPMTFSKIDHILGQKPSLSKYKKTEMIPYIFSHHSSLKLEVNKKKNSKTCKQLKADQHIAQ
jgi:hypothetical protein